MQRLTLKLAARGLSWPCSLSNTARRSASWLLSGDSCEGASSGGGASSSSVVESSTANACSQHVLMRHMQ